MKFTLKDGLLCGSSSQHLFIRSTINRGPNLLDKGILFCCCKASITSKLEIFPQGSSPLEKISNKRTPKENTSLFEEILTLNMTSGALHYYLII